MYDAEIARLRGYIKSQSRFLTQDVERHPEWLADLVDRGDLRRGFTRPDFERRLFELPAYEAIAHQYASFRRQQLLRILLREIDDPPVRPYRW